ncbi:MAG: sigma-70 family RNA polymerase sigma factor [Gammaproteobacteria bacterium]|nr:sigma-70 family RNA polymerase sigma factor [Gammaproteobacteria bacterium]
MADSVLERIAAGDQTAVRDCMDEFSGLVWSLARRFSDSTADAEDASQEIFLEIWKSAARYDSSMGSEATFITTIARRRLIDRLRSKKRRPQTEEFDETHFPEEDTSVPVAMGTEVAAAKEALAALAPEQREVLMLGIVEGMTHSEIATQTGRPLGTVKTQMRRGMQKVRKLLEQTEAAND